MATVTRSGWSPLVPIQTEGSGTPFFCVHGAMGSVLILQDLARHLGNERPMYGLQAQGVDGKLQPLERIEDMATQYVSAIRRVQPHGPYLLGGYSGGGVVAFEMAQQLRTMDENAALVALLDTYSPLVRARQLTWGEKLQKVVEGGLQLLWSKTTGVWTTRRFNKKLREIERYVARGIDIPLELRETRMWLAYGRTQKCYRPTIYSGRLTLFRAAEIAQRGELVSHSLCWESLTEEPIEVHEVPGGHHNFLCEPAVQGVAVALKASLKRAEPQERGRG